jgi:hypothetical protein
MIFNFHEKYKEYSTFDLLLITKRSSEFQPTAVEAAILTLSQREVTDEELLEVDQYLANLEADSHKRREKIKFYKEQIAAFLDPLLRPGTDVKPGKWLKILLLVIGLQYCWSLYATIEMFVRFMNCRYCSFDILSFFQFINLVYVPVIFFLLYKKRTWGWILLLADNVFSLILLLGQTFLFFNYQKTLGDLGFIWPIVIKGAFIFFLLREEIITFFQVKGNVKKNTITITVIVAIILTSIMAIIFG